MRETFNFISFFVFFIGMILFFITINDFSLMTLGSIILIILGLTSMAKTS